MTAQSLAARAAIMDSIRAHLAASVPEDARAHEEPPVPAHKSRNALPLFVDPLSPPSQPFAEALPVATRFLERARAVGVHCHVVATDDDARAMIAGILRTAKAESVGLSDAPVLAPLRHGAPVGWRVIADIAVGEMFTCDAGVTAAQLGIAETGTVGLMSAHERNRLLSLVPPLHIAVLRASDLSDTIADALARVRRDDKGGAVASHAITFITGPSRTSDIELTLAIGVHGPQELHVVLID